MADENLIRIAGNAAATIRAVYQWVDRVKEAGSTTTVSGVAACHAMLTSLETNHHRVNSAILDPLDDAIYRAIKNPPMESTEVERLRLVLKEIDRDITGTIRHEKTCATIQNHGGHLCSCDNIRVVRNTKQKIAAALEINSGE